MTLRDWLANQWGTLMRDPRRIRLEREETPEKIAYDETVRESADAREYARRSIEQAQEKKVWLEEALSMPSRTERERRERGAYS
jgi:hypothetical protein